MQTADDLLTIDQAAPILGISPCSLRLLIHAGKICHMRIGPNGGRYRLRREWLDDYLQSCVYSPASDVGLSADKPQRVIRQPKQARIVKGDANQPLASFKDELKTFKKQMKDKGTAK